MDKQKDKPEWTFQWATFGDSEYWMLHRNGIPVNGEDNESEVLKILNDHRPWVPIEEKEPEEGDWEITVSKLCEDEEWRDEVENDYYYTEKKNWHRNWNGFTRKITAYRILARPYKKQP